MTVGSLDGHQMMMPYPLDAEGRKWRVRCECKWASRPCKDREEALGEATNHARDVRAGVWKPEVAHEGA